MGAVLLFISTLPSVSMPWLETGSRSEELESHSEAGFTPSQHGHKSVPAMVGSTLELLCSHQSVHGCVLVSCPHPGHGWAGTEVVLLSKRVFSWAPVTFTSVGTLQ